MWKLVLDFSCKVEESWKEYVWGVFMYWLIVKMRRLKIVFKEIKRGNFDDIEKIERRC